jgi:hypothetical protein
LFANRRLTCVELEILTIASLRGGAGDFWIAWRARLARVLRMGRKDSDSAAMQPGQTQAGRGYFDRRGLLERLAKPIGKETTMRNRPCNGAVAEIFRAAPDYAVTLLDNILIVGGQGTLLVLAGLRQMSKAFGDRARPLFQA